MHRQLESQGHRSRTGENDMTEQEMIGITNQASKEWLKEFPTPEETAHQVPKRFLEIFAKLVAEKEREECACMSDWILKEGGGTWGDAIRARGQE